MKKLVFLSALFALVAALVFTACKKDETTQSTHPNCSNTANPFDMVGQRHNDGLDVLSQYTTGKKLDIAEDYRILGEHGFGNFDHRLFANDLVLIISSSDPIKAISDKMRKEGKMSDELHAAYAQLNEILKTRCFTGQLTIDVRAFEATIPELGLSPDEERALYVSTSIARYSNQYWSDIKAKTANDRMPKWIHDALVIGADVVGGGIVALEGGGWLEVVVAAAGASAEMNDWLGSALQPGGDGDDLGNLDLEGITAYPDFGWPWGGGIFGPPCAPGYACPCTIDLDPLTADQYYMAGLGAAITQEVVFLNMDGSRLDPKFLQGLDSGNFYLDRDFTVPQEVVAEIMKASGFDTPSEPTVFPQGDKQVLAIGNSYCIIFPVTYPDGTSANWSVNIGY